MVSSFPYRKVFLTGSTGVVGKKIIENLSKYNLQVSALVRDEDGKKFVEQHKAKAVFGDVLDDNLHEKISDAELIFHIAGVNKMCSRDPSEMFNVNIKGTENMINAANKTRVEAFVYTSSAVTIGEKIGALGQESTVHRGNFLSKYEESKYLAEEKAFGMRKDYKFISINPSSVQGPGRTSGTAKILKYVLNSSFPFMIDNNISVVDIDDCANGHILGAIKGKNNHRYILNSFHVPSKELINKLKDLTDWKKDPIFLPKPLIRQIGYLGDIYKLISKSNPLVCSESVRVLAHGHKYDGSKAKRDLGLNYKSVDQFIVDTIQWLNEQELIKVKVE